MAGIEDEEKRLSKMDMLAELYYHEADTVGQPTRDELLNKAFMLFDMKILWMTFTSIVFGKKF